MDSSMAPNTTNPKPNDVFNKCEETRPLLIWRTGSPSTVKSYIAITCSPCENGLIRDRITQENHENEKHANLLNAPIQQNGAKWGAQKVAAIAAGENWDWKFLRRRGKWITHMSKPVQQALHCKWDNNKHGAHGGQSPCGCIFQRPLSTIAGISHNLSSQENSQIQLFLQLAFNRSWPTKKLSFCGWSSSTDSAARRGSNMSSSQSWSHRQKNPQQSIAWCICRLVLHSFCKVIQHPQQCCHHSQEPPLNSQSN